MLVFPPGPAALWTLLGCFGGLWGLESNCPVEPPTLGETLQGSAAAPLLLAWLSVLQGFFVCLFITIYFTHFPSLLLLPLW